MKKWIQRNKTELIAIFVLLYAACVAPTFLIEHRMMLFSLKKDCILPSAALLCVIFIMIIGHIPSAEFLDRKEKLLRLRKEKYLREEYCEWINNKTEEFLHRLAKNGFTADWGFQTYIPSYKWYGKECEEQKGLCVFDLRPLQILAMDEHSKQMLYCTYTGLPFSQYLKGDRILNYQYVLIPYSMIRNATEENDGHEEHSTETIKESVPWHGTGMSSQGLTTFSGHITQTKTVPTYHYYINHTSLTIKTDYPGCEEIKFEVNEDSEYVQRPGKMPFTKETIRLYRSDMVLLTDVRCGFLGRQAPFIKYTESERDSDFGTAMDCIFSYDLHDDAYDRSLDDDEKRIIKELDSVSNIQYYWQWSCEGHISSAQFRSIPEEETPAQPVQGTQNELPEIISQAEEEASVIGSPPVASESDDGVVTVELQMDTTDKARTIIELAKLKREGLITKDEFDKLKNELMEQNS